MNSDDHSLSRRFFLGAATVLGSGSAPRLLSAAEQVSSISPDGKLFHEPAMTLPWVSDVDGLMMAGRCISGDFIAHASYRVTGNAVAMGEAAGVVATIAAQSQRLPHEVEWKEGLAILHKIGLRG